MQEIKNVELLKKLNGQIDRLTDLISDLLDSTKITEGRLELKQEKLDLNALIREMTEEVQRTTKKHTMVPKLQDLPELTGDSERIGQVLTNLLTNAVKYSPKGGDIIIKSQRFDKYVKVTVTDNGIGVSKDAQSSIFENFFRITNPKMQTYPGMGLGLYITTGIIQRHGGTVSVESEEGKGSSFSFTLPY